MSLPYLLQILWEIGPTLPGAMGPVPISQTEILAWQINMRHALEPGEVSMLRRLSMEWIAMSQDAEDPDCPAPWTTEAEVRAQHARATQNLRAAMRRMAA